MDTQYDREFENIQGLTWLPWIGHKYCERSPKKRLLVVGESHYYKGETPEECQIAKEEYVKDRNTTRGVVMEALIDHDWPNRTLNTIPKLLFKSADIDHQRLWSDSAFYNFIQRPMNYSGEYPERPTWDDFHSAWKIFTDVVEIIQPSHCLFIGVEAAKSFGQGEVIHTQKIGRTWARKSILEVRGGRTELIFVQHLGRYFSWTLWHDYLREQHSDLMGWLDEQAYHC